MDNQYVIDECEACGKKAFIVIYPTAEDNIRETAGAADRFEWDCPECHHLNTMPIANISNAVNRS